MTRSWISAAALGAALLGGCGTGWAQTTLKVMSFNIYGGGANEGKSIDETVAAIKAANPDVISISETRAESDPCTAESCPPAGPSIAADLAAALGFQFHDQTGDDPAIWANAVLSRYPIVSPTADELGVTIDVEGRRITVFSVNLDDAPYQPYQLLDIEYGSAPFLKTAAEAISSAEATRGKAFDDLVKDAEAAMQAGSEAVFIDGDFNEPSHRDWTEATVKAGLQPLAVAWPGTTKLEAAGFTDTFRAVHPDPVATPGMTWTPTSEPTDPEDHHDRIDFVFAKAKDLKVLDSKVVGEKEPEAAIVVTPWPSDHRAVISTVTF
ncbi:exodeoxyribonuclease III (xth) [Hartmannibacter diazotrophicus]|uniref:Exodeoxyribonuclease III (Xth) n=1 Tax=Hartmannibacter diazotrophicus TaxID=1482074 RepID=A0A2C9D9M8_9HYPH|nr:endonuclease/exonuclease/phosphatase family protein [Hartmannibacter diazotrophicus]SON56976.1 exodeoxyribonuclease III (xth) [Hartmannibacter diazotrophicus]